MKLKTYKKYKPGLKTKLAVLLIILFTAILPCRAVLAAENMDTTLYKLADLDLQVSVSNELICFTQNVTSNNAYLDLIGADDVEELRSMMKINHVYLEIIPEDVAYEILINGQAAGDAVPRINTLSEEELNSVFEQYVSGSDKIKNDSVTENVTDSYIYTHNNVHYFVTDVTSVANNNVTIYLRKYYTVMMDKVITFTLQSNGKPLTDEMSGQLLNIVQSAEYKTIHKSIFENVYFTEITTTLISLLFPIALLVVIAVLISRSKRKTKKQIAAEEERLRAKYAAEEAEQKEQADNPK